MGKINKQQVQVGWRRMQVWLAVNAGINLRRGKRHIVCIEYAKVNNILLDKTKKNWDLLFIINQYNDPNSKIYKDTKQPKSPFKKAKSAKRDRKKEYNEYMRSDKWIKFSKEIKNKRGNKCEICGISGVTLDAHHLTYERFTNELEEDIQIVCRPCHERIHGKKIGYKKTKYTRTAYDTALNRLFDVIMAFFNTGNVPLHINNSDQELKHINWLMFKRRKVHLYHQPPLIEGGEIKVVGWEEITPKT